MDKLFIIFGVFVFIAFLSCNNASTLEGSEDNSYIPEEVDSITRVSTALVELKPFEYLIESNGKIKSLREQLISAESSGRILASAVRNGANVLQGEILVQVDTFSVHQKLAGAQLVLFNSEKNYESELLGYETLLKGKTQEQAIQIRQKLRISSGLAAAEQQIIELKNELTKSSIRAPFSGVLADVKIQDGQVLKPGDELFRLYDPINLILEVKVLEVDIAVLKLGMPAVLSPISETKRSYNAFVYEINPYVDLNGLVTVKLKITKSSDRLVNLFPGMNCIAQIKVPFSKTLIVAKDAVVVRNGRSVVFTVEGGRAKWNYVKTGRDNGNEIEIKEGLKLGQEVIVSNNRHLSHDTPVAEKSVLKDTLQKTN